MRSASRLNLRAPPGSVAGLRRGRVVYLVAVPAWFASRGRPRCGVAPGRIEALGARLQAPGSRRPDLLGAGRWALGAGRWALGAARR